MACSRLDFGGLGLDFGGFGDDFFLQFNPARASLKCLAVPQHSCPLMGRWRWPPPRGSSMELEPSWPFWPPKTLVQLPWGLLKLNVFSKCRLGKLQARFWRVCGGSWEGLGRVLGQKKNWPCPKTPRNAKNLSRTCQDLARTQRLSKKVLLDGEQGGPLQQLGRRCPPLAGFKK